MKSRIVYEFLPGRMTAWWQIGALFSQKFCRSLQLGTNRRHGYYLIDITSLSGKTATNTPPPPPFRPLFESASHLLHERMPTL